MNLKVFKRTNNKEVLINADNITYIITSPERETECLIYFNGTDDNSIRVKHDIKTVENKLRSSAR